MRVKNKSYMMKQQYIKFLLTVIMSIMGITAFAHHFEVANAYGVTIYYLKTSDTEVAVSCKGSSSDLVYHNEYAGDVVIPKSVTYNGVTYSVTSIGEKAFCRCSGLTSVTIPNSVTSVGNSAFEECSGLYAITFPSSVTSIGDNAFYNCTYLNYVTIPNSVTCIGYSAFEGCSSLPYITIPNSVIRIENYTFYGCISLNSVTISNSVTSIGEYAFGGCSSLTSIEIPNSVTRIGKYAFRGCGLTSIMIPSSVTNIGDNAFYGCGHLKTVKISVSDYSTFCNNKIAIYIYKYIGKNPILIDEKGNEINEYVIPDDVTSIGEYAFYNCSGLTSIMIPNSVTSIENGAFCGCSGLTSVTVLNPTPVAITQYVFTNRLNATLYVPKGSRSAYEAADYWKEFKEIVEIDFIIPGDANSDGLVNVTDIVATVNYIMNKPSDDFNKYAADVNGDGEVNVTDVVGMVNIIMKGDN